MPWYFFAIEFISGVFLTNGIPHFVQGLCGNRFQSPFASPPGEGESSPMVNVLWGFLNLVIGAVLLAFFYPTGTRAWLGWTTLAGGSLAIAVMLAWHFGKVRSDNSRRR